MIDLHVAVIFDTRHGTTEKVARAIARGIARVPGVGAEVDFAPEVHPEVLDRSHLIVIGGPTEYLSASKHLKELFGRIGAYDLHDKFGFAFDTHAARPFSGSAARFIEGAMRRLRLTVLEPRSSALVEDGSGAGNGGGLHLADGTEARFETIGGHLAKELLAAVKARRDRSADLGEDQGWTS